MKKRRTRAQIAATKKLVAFNKKRRGKKTVKKARKKRRTAKQIAATKKLVALNKRRGKKRTVRRKNPKRQSTRKVKRAATGQVFWSIFKCYGESVRYLGVSPKGKVFWTIRDAAVSWRFQKNAANAARSVAKKPGMSKYHIGVASSKTSTQQIRAACKAGNTGKA